MWSNMMKMAFGVVTHWTIGTLNHYGIWDKFNIYGTLGT